MWAIRFDGEDAVKEGADRPAGKFVGRAFQCLYDMIDEYRASKEKEDGLR